VVHQIRLNLRHLRAVTAIVESGSISRAARAVNLTQPAITQAVAKLEDQLGIQLFERAPAGMAATEAGRTLAARAAGALQFIASNRVTGPQMQAFIALAKAGSYAGAAAALGVREPSLHRAVADLSLGLGQKLVERRGRGIGFTARGATIARRFRLAQAELDSALLELERLRGREVGKISIGAMPLSRAQLLPNAISEFHHAYPEVAIAIAEGAHAELIGPLRDGEVDFTIGALRSGLSADLVQRPLFVDRPVVLGRSNHPLAAAATKLNIEQLAAYPWIVPPAPTPLREQWAQMFESCGNIAPRVAIECGSVILVRQLLMQDNFLTLLSPAQVAVELEAGWLARICAAPGDPKRTIGITHRLDWRPTQLQTRFLETIEKQAAMLESIEA
jgi:DNA-binding transcriptional LysR family regulator